MTVYRPGNSPYYHYDFQFRGVRYCRSTGCTSKADAKRAEAEARRDATLPRKARDAIMLDEAASLYASKVDRKPSWPDTRRILAALIVAIGGTRLLDGITQRDLMAVIAKRRNGRADSSVNREIVVWRAMWRHAETARFDVGDMPNWGALLMHVPNTAPRSASHEEEDDLFAALRPDFHPVIRFLLLTGWRRNEVLGLTWRDIDLSAAVARVTIKGGDVIERPLTPAMVALIANQPKAAFAVFTFVAQATRAAHTDKGGRKREKRVKGERYPIGETVLHKAFMEARKASDVQRFRLHDLRHTRGTRMLRVTGNLAAASRALGHKSLKTTMRYAHSKQKLPA
jgi:integrase